MERIIRKNNAGEIACNDTIIYSKDKSEIGRGLVGIYDDWIIIEPKYYKYLDDDCIVEIWYDSTGIVISNGLNKYLKIGMIENSWNDTNAIKISYKEAMQILEEKQNKKLEYSNKDLMSREIIDSVNNGSVKESLLKIDYAGDDAIDAMAYVIKALKQKNNGGASDWYSLPKKATTLQDLIEHRNMNGSIKDIFKACYRLGIKTEDELRDLNKMAYYSLREIGRITGRKDYITIAKELMGEQAIEKDEKIFKGLK